MSLDNNGDGSLSLMDSLKVDVISKELKQKIRYHILNNKEGIKETLKQLSPEEIFDVFDDDDSGLISFEEFRKLLPYLGISVNDAKAYRYFRLCDIDGSGQIDIDEFKVVLFLCDPSSGNQVGYTPKQYITPLDAFELFDEDHSGDMDEDEFAYALEYIGVRVSDAVIEKLFEECDIDNSGKIDYEEFRDTFIKVCDVKQELSERGIDVPLFSKTNNLRQVLRGAILEEEKRERSAVAETLKYKIWMSSVKDKRIYVERAMFRAHHELRKALDLSGHVYVFGNGSNDQFTGNVAMKLQSSSYRMEYYDIILNMWRDRVDPKTLADKLRLSRKSDQLERKRELNRKIRRGEYVDEQLYKPNYILDPYLEAKSSLFTGMNVAINTAGLYGRRVKNVAISENVLFALSDTGEIFAWGGHDYTWHEIQADSVNQSKWRGDTTPRSQLLLGTVTKDLAIEDTDDLGGSIAIDDKKADIIQALSKYFNVWEPPPDPANKVQFVEKVLFPKISYEDIKFALYCRGKKIDIGSKFELAEKLYGDIALEKKLLGEKSHKSIKSLEIQLSSLLKRKKDHMAKKILSRIECMWQPLNEVQQMHLSAMEAEHNKLSKLSIEKGEVEYLNWRNKVSTLKSLWGANFNRDVASIVPVDTDSIVHHKGHHRKVGVFPPANANEGTSLPIIHDYDMRKLPSSIQLSGITPRGSDMCTPRGDSTVLAIAAGSNQAFALHESGHVYSWGVNISGRLGLSNQSDASQATLVSALLSTKISQISCGYSHTGAISCDGDVFMWGSVNTGKAGIGSFIEGKECFLSTPTKLTLPSISRHIVKLSCGYAHSAFITDNGHLYVFGCGDGGRLGMGFLDTIYTPTLVSSLVHECIHDVSCGNCSTIISTQVVDLHDDDRTLSTKGSKRDSVSIDRTRGGRVFVAGSSFVLGKNYHTFTVLDEIKDLPIVQVSAGYRHSALVSISGELLCWGNNIGGCCGVDQSTTFVQIPQVIKAMHYQAENLAYQANCYQSSTFRDRHAPFAVNGRKDGMGLQACSCTLEESHAWLEVDLGNESIIEEIWIWNRSDTPQAEVGGLPRDFFTSRLFPMWIMVGTQEFEKGINLASYQKNLAMATAKMKFSDNKRVSKWRCNGIQGKYVRIQLQEYNFLNIAEIEVFGRPRISAGVGRVSSVTAGRDCTVAVIHATSSYHDAEKAYKRAVYSDAVNADVLRQLPTYATVYDKYGKDIHNLECPMCTKRTICEICRLYKEYDIELQGKCTRLDGLNKICEILLEDTRINLPLIEKVKKDKQNPFSSIKIPNVLKNIWKGI